MYTEHHHIISSPRAAYLVMHALGIENEAFFTTLV